MAKIQSNDDRLSDNSIGSVPTDQSKKFLGGMYHPWRRFFARTIDLLSIGLILYFIFIFFIVYLAGAGYLNAHFVDGFTQFMENPVGAGVVLYLLWIPFEAAFLSLFGATPGKWIFGIRVINSTSGKLSYINALKRSFFVLVQGDGAGIPLVALITRFFAYRRLTKTGTTLWDASVDSIVTHKQWGIIRAFVSVLSVLVVVFIISVLNSMGNISG